MTAKFCAYCHMRRVGVLFVFVLTTFSHCPNVSINLALRSRSRPVVTFILSLHDARLPPLQCRRRRARHHRIGCGPGRLDRMVQLFTVAATAAAARRQPVLSDNTPTDRPAGRTPALQQDRGGDLFSRMCAVVSRLDVCSSSPNESMAPCFRGATDLSLTSS